MINYIPYLNKLDIQEKMNNSLSLKIDNYHFFPKRFSTDKEVASFDNQSFIQTLTNLIKPEDKTFFITLKNGVISGLNETLKKYISIGYHSKDFITIYFNNDVFFSSPANLNIVLLEIDFTGALEFKSVGGTRTSTHNTFENSINLLHYQIQSQRKKSLYVFNFEDINNNPIGMINNKLPEGKDLPVFFNYFNLTKNISNNYLDHNFVFNLSIPANISFFQSKEKNTILKNNVMVNTLKNPFTQDETKINVSYFKCIDNGQLRDDSFEVNHINSNFHSNINYFSLNSGTSTSQVNTFIAPDAPKSKSHQHLKHILLNDKSISFSKPNLMIENPDVESSHGNTMGGLNKDNLIYLQQRGISEERAKVILAHSAIEKASDTPFFSYIIKQYLMEKTND